MADNKIRTLTINGRFPGLNDYIEAERANRYRGAAMKRQFEHVVILCAKAQLRGFHPGRVKMTYLWVEPDQRRDKDNVSSFGRKIIQDGLVKAGILKNDGWNEIQGFRDMFAVDKTSPRIVVEIEDVGK